MGPYIQSPFSEYLEKQKLKLHRKPGEHLAHVSARRLLVQYASSVYYYHQESSRLQQLFGYVLLLMICYFVISIVNSMAQSYAKRLDEEELQPRYCSSKPSSKTD